MLANSNFMHFHKMILHLCVINIHEKRLLISLCSLQEFTVIWRVFILLYECVTGLYGQSGLQRRREFVALLNHILYYQDELDEQASVQ